MRAALQSVTNPVRGHEGLKPLLLLLLSQTGQRDDEADEDDKIFDAVEVRVGVDGQNAAEKRNVNAQQQPLRRSCLS